MSGHKEGHKQTFEEEIIPRAICFTIQHNDELRFKKNNLSGRKLSKIINFERHNFESCSAKPTCKIM